MMLSGLTPVSSSHSNASAFRVASDARNSVRRSERTLHVVMGVRMVVCNSGPMFKGSDAALSPAPKVAVSGHRKEWALLPRSGRAGGDRAGPVGGAPCRKCARACRKNALLGAVLVY